MFLPLRLVNDALEATDTVFDVVAKGLSNNSLRHVSSQLSVSRCFPVQQYGADPYSSFIDIRVSRVYFTVAAALSAFYISKQFSQADLRY